jgi:hypothetical protein
MECVISIQHVPETYAASMCAIMAQLTSKLLLLGHSDTFASSVLSLIQVYWKHPIFCQQWSTYLSHIRIQHFERVYATWLMELVKGQVSPLPRDLLTEKAVFFHVLVGQSVNMKRSGVQQILTERLLTEIKQPLAAIELLIHFLITQRVTPIALLTQSVLKRSVYQLVNPLLHERKS